MSPGYAIITGMACGFETVDYSGVLLRCSHEQWEEHIIGRHSELAGQQAAVIAALRDPYYVFIPAGPWANRRVYYRPLVLRQPYTNHHLLVVADYPPRRRRYGRVVTAYPRETLGKEILENRGTLLWTKPGIMG